MNNTINLNNERLSVDKKNMKLIVDDKKLKKGGELIGTGSKTCIFKPNIPCKNKNKNSDKYISKVFLSKGNKYIDKEIRINKIINEINKSDIWSIVLFNKCELDNYKDILKVEKDIEKCLLKFDVSINEFNQNKLMLYGLYGGIGMKEQIKNIFKKSFSPKLLIKFMKQTHSLFYGINELQKNNILHYDIKEGNILFQKKKFKFIDFGISTTFDNTEAIKTRILKEYQSSRVYPSYSFDLYFIFLDEYYLNKEIKYHIFSKRENYKQIELTHKIAFNRDINDEIIKLAIDIKNKKITLEQIVKSADTYSLGFTITLIVIQQINNSAYFKDLKKYNNFTDILNQPEVKPIIDLLKEMTELSPIKRIKPNDALKQLKKILNYYPKY